MKSKLKRYKVHGLTVKDIARLCKWSEVKRAMKYYYPKTNKDTMGRYEEIFEDVKEMLWSGESDPTERVVLRCWSDFLDVEIPEYYSISTNRYSMSFRPWSELANIKIDNVTLDNNLRPEIITHFLWEITYYGWHEKDMNKVSKRLGKQVDEVKKSIEAGTLKTTTLDEFKEELKKKQKAKKKK